MEFKKITPEMREKLREKLPDEAVKPHPTKTYLSSIKAIYVVERLNDVFGVGSWRLPSEVLGVDHGMVVVRAFLHIDDYNIHLEAFGGNDNGGEDNNKNFDLGDAYKGAVTDAFTKICSYLEIGIDVFKGKHTGKSNDNSQGGTNGQPAGDRSNFVFGNPKDETIPWVKDKEVDEKIAELNKGVTEERKLEIVAKLKNRRWSKENKEKILNALEVKG